MSNIPLEQSGAFNIYREGGRRVGRGGRSAPGVLHQAQRAARCWRDKRWTAFHCRAEQGKLFSGQSSLDGETEGERNTQILNAVLHQMCSGSK